VLRDIHFRVDPGEMVALVGPSGAGKTTLMALLQRFHDPTLGAVLLDGVDIRRLRQNSVRRQIGVVGQDAPLFNESLRENISLELLERSGYYSTLVERQIRGLIGVDPRTGKDRRKGKDRRQGRDGRDSQKVVKAMPTMIPE
jgi:ABC-type bacteriocin/lantibiotic exporter with double-glycine peptidase domain